MPADGICEGTPCVGGRGQGMSGKALYELELPRRLWGHVLPTKCFSEFVCLVCPTFAVLFLSTSVPGLS